MDPRFAKGDRVRIKALGGRVGIIDGDPKLLGNVWMYPVSVDPQQESPYYPETALEPYKQPKSVLELLESREFAPARRFVRTLIYRKLARPLSDNLYTFYASRTKFLVHQFKPVMKLLSTDKQRLLLADEVGLGKTIEAGIILTELEARLGSLSRVLVVCPSMLTRKWKSELRTRFGQEFQILDPSGFEAFIDRFAQYGEAEKLRGICSLQGIRREKIINRLKELSPPFDLTIVDEAHHLRNPETLSNELGEVLASLSDAVLFLTATPLQLGTPDLFNLFHLLVPEDFPNLDFFHHQIAPNEFLNNALRRLYDPPEALAELHRLKHTVHWPRFERDARFDEVTHMLSNSKTLSREQAIYAQRLLTELNPLSHVFTRTKKRDVEMQFPLREARVVPVHFTKAEMDFYDAVTKYVAEEFTARLGSGQGMPFAVIMPQRQVASCIQAAKSKFGELVGAAAAKDAAHTSREEGDDEDLIDPYDDDLMWPSRSKQAQAARQLVRLGQQIGDTDTKFDQFLHAVRQVMHDDPQSKLIVFSFFKRTLRHLLSKLARTEFGDQVVILHGDVPLEDRDKTMDRFRRNAKIRILLSSDVGGEGLDFEFCNVLFNYDLPWNPMRVEQRIGRLDRFGQKHEKILIFNFSMKGTIDDAILERLFLRINIFEQYVGDLEAIIGEEIQTLVRDVFNTRLSNAQKEERIEQVALVLERRRQDLGNFERESAKFLGQDEYFTEEVSRILQAKRFITGDEVKQFLASFAEDEFPTTTLKPPKSGRDKVYVLKTDGEFRRFVYQHLSGDERRTEVDRRLGFDGGSLVTFDSETAISDANLDFLTIHHPIVRAIKHYLDENQEDIRITANIQLTDPKGRVGYFFFFLYLLEKLGLKRDLHLVPVLVSTDCSNVHIQDDLTEWFQAELVNAEDLLPGQADYQSDQLLDAAHIAAEHMELFREDEENTLRRLNDRLVDARIESRKDAYAIKIRKTDATIRRLMQDGRPESIIRLNQGIIRRLEAEREEKIKDLNRKRPVSVTMSLIAGGSLRLATEVSRPA